MNKLTPITFFLLVLTLNSVQAQVDDVSGNYSVGTSNTQIEFSARHLRIFQVEGTFKEFSGDIKLSDGVLVSGSLEIMVSSITTGNQSRDKSLKSEDFLHSKGFPSIYLHFTSNSNARVVLVSTKIKEVEQNLELNYEIKPDMKLRVSCSISRNDFQLDFGTMDDLVSDEIKVTAVVDLKRKKP